MQVTNSKQRYGAMAIYLHWIMAMVLIGLVVIGLYMTSIPLSINKVKLYDWHKEWGILVLMLVMLRIVWRLGNITPSLHFLPVWERIAARTVQWAFYVFMFILPITGWLLTSAAGLPVSFFGLWVLPNLIAPNHANLVLFEAIHTWLSYGLIATFCLHVAAALKHHFINKDKVLRGMWP